MISAEYCQLMARYNTWQNASLIVAANALDDAQRWADRGAFFGSIAATFNHLLWDDALWLRRLSGDERPESSLSPSLEDPRDWTAFKALRLERDKALEDWALGADTDDIKGEVFWYPSGGAERIGKPRAMCIVHLFNHQTHHRGQIHSMLTAAGSFPEPTDLPRLS